MKILKIASIALLSLLLLAAMVVYFFFRSTIPAADGILPGCDISRETIIERSPRGVPTIKADSVADLFFAVGFVHAQDRLFQMDLQRRAANGRLAEVLGERWLERDIGQHYLQAASGIEKSFRALIPEVRDLLENYCRGVNCARASQALPPEFHVLRYVPEAWQVRDVLATMKFLEGELASSGGELNHARLLAAMDKGSRRDWLAAAPRAGFDDRNSFWSRALSVPPLPRFLAAEAAAEGLDPSGSAWAVAGSRTDSGRPVLANDFSWPPRLPALFYQVVGRTPAMEISGNTLPGVPFIFSGRNRHLGWGVSPDRSDTLDFFLLEGHPDNPRLYRCEDRWLELEYREERIRCRGREPFRLRLPVSRFGPVIEAAGGLLAMRSLVQYRSHALEALYLMNAARGPKELAAAARRFSVPALRVVFADRKGNIGVTRTGMEPRRGRGDGMLPQRVLVPGDAWTGFGFTGVDPAVMNPGKGWVSAGDVPQGPEPRFFSFAVPAGHRSRRLEQLLAGASGLDTETAARLQNDTLVPEAEYLVGLIQGMPLVSQEASQVRGILAAWDLNAGDGVGPSYFYEFEKLLADAVFAPLLRDGAARSGISPRWLYGALRSPGLLKRQALVAAVDESLAACQRAFRRRSRSQDDGWNWEVQHAASFGHPLGVNFFLRPLFERGPLAVRGGNASLLDAGFDGRSGFAVTRLAAYKMILDLSAPAASLLVYPGGQSGHPLSPAYDDQLGAFVSQKYYKMEEPGRRIHRLRLLPGTGAGALR